MLKEKIEQLQRILEERSHEPEPQAEEWDTSALKEPDPPAAGGAVKDLLRTASLATKRFGISRVTPRTD